MTDTVLDILLEAQIATIDRLAALVILRSLKDVDTTQMLADLQEQKNKLESLQTQRTGRPDDVAAKQEKQA